MLKVDENSGFQHHDGRHAVDIPSVINMTIVTPVTANPPCFLQLAPSLWLTVSTTGVACHLMTSVIVS